VDAEASSHEASSLFPSRTENRMTPVDHLAEAWLRHKWADQAGEAFQRSCVEFTSTDPYLVYAQWEAESWELSFRGPRDPALEAENLTELSRLLGAFVDHAHAALNYTAYQVALLAIRENPYLTDPTTPDDKRLKSIPSDFPIYDSQTLYRRDNRLKKLPSKYVDPIKAVQPYNRGHDPLWRLHALAGEFRHRIVHPAMVWPVTGRRRALRADAGNRRGRRGRLVLQASVLGAPAGKRRDCPGVRGVLFEVPEASMSGTPPMNAANDNAARKGLRGWWASPPRPGMQRLIKPWEYRHRRAFGVTRIAGSFVAATAGVVCLSYAAYGWAPSSWFLGC
jgi:hypothetical protein